MMEKKSRGPKSNKAADPRTLFVKFHPPSAFITRQHLSDHFSNYGPVNRCSVIRQQKPKQRGDAADADNEEEPNLDRGSKGYGFVRFVHEDDAKTAADAIQKNSKGRKSAEVMIVDGVRYKLHAERAVDASTAGSSPKKERGTPIKKETRQATTDVPTPVDASKEDADSKYKAESKRKRTSRVIIRNLSFYANEKHIKAAMETEFGPVAAVDLPLVPGLPNENNQHAKNNQNAVPRHRGFAFVTFTNANAAKQAVEQGSEIKIKNRQVAIDFSVSKLEHQKMMKEQKNKAGKKDDTESESDSDSDGEKDSGDDSDDDSSDSDEDSSDSEDSQSEDESEDEAEEASKAKNNADEDSTAEKETPEFDQSEAKRTLFLRNIPFDAKRHDVFELFRTFGRIEAVYLVKDRQTGVFKGTAFVRFEKQEGSAAAMEASGIGGSEQNEGGDQFVSSKNMAMGIGQDGTSGLMLNGRHILVDLAVDRTTASSLAVQRDADGKPIKKMVGKDKRNLYLKNEGRVSSQAESADAVSASAKHGGLWEDLPPSDRAKRERAFADKSTKLRSPLFFINPNRLSIRNLGKHITEVDLKKLAFGALKTGMEQNLATPKDAVSHWRAGGELAHGEVMRRATDPNLVFPPLDEKNLKGSVASVFIDRDVSGGKKTVDAPSRGFGFVEFTHHTHALAVLRQLNNNPVYSAEFAAGGKHAAEMANHKRGKKIKKAKADPETGADFVTEDGKVCVPRLLVEFTVENKVKARQQAEKVAQKKANKIKQRIEKKDKEKEEKQNTSSKKEKKKGRGQLQREKKRARKEGGEDNEENEKDKESASKKQKTDASTAVKPTEKKQKMVKPQKKKQKTDKDEDALEDMIRSYKSSFSKGPAGSRAVVEEKNANEVTKKGSREKVEKKRWFE